MIFKIFEPPNAFSTKIAISQLLRHFKAVNHLRLGLAPKLRIYWDP